MLSTNTAAPYANRNIVCMHAELACSKISSSVNVLCQHTPTAALDFKLSGCKAVAPYIWRNGKGTCHAISTVCVHRQHQIALMKCMHIYITAAVTSTLTGRHAAVESNAVCQKSATYATVGHVPAQTVPAKHFSAMCQEPPHKGECNPALIKMPMTHYTLLKQQACTSWSAAPFLTTDSCCLQLLVLANMIYRWCCSKRIASTQTIMMIRATVPNCAQGCNLLTSQHGHN